MQFRIELKACELLARAGVKVGKVKANKRQTVTMSPSFRALIQNVQSVWKTFNIMIGACESSVAMYFTVIAGTENSRHWIHVLFVVVLHAWSHTSCMLYMNVKMAQRLYLKLQSMQIYQLPPERHWAVSLQRHRQLLKDL